MQAMQFGRESETRRTRTNYQDFVVGWNSDHHLTKQNGGFTPCLDQPRVVSTGEDIAGESVAFARGAAHAYAARQSTSSLSIVSCPTRPHRLAKRSPTLGCFYGRFKLSGRPEPSSECFVFD
jgi:hypothetical protein